MATGATPHPADTIDFSDWALLARRLRHDLRTAMLRQQLFGVQWGRVIEATVCSVLILLGSPLLLCAAAYAMVGKPMVRRVWVAGRHGRAVELLRFDDGSSFGKFLGSLGLAGYPAFITVLLGDLALVGPRARPFVAGSKHAWHARRRLTVRPGLIGTHWLRRRGNVDYEPEDHDDVEYVEAHSVSYDLGVLLRAMLLGVTRPRAAAASPMIEVAGVRIDNLSMEGAVEAIVQRCDGRAQTRVAFLNAHCINVASSSARYRAAIKSADLVFADGVGMRIAGRMWQHSLRHNVNGTDLFPRLCQALHQRRGSIYLLGGLPGVAAGVASYVRTHYRQVQVLGAQDGYFSREESTDVARRIRECRPDVLLVALGVPLQDEWLQDNLADAGARVGIGVGGLFDFYSGRIPRAPVWIREIGLEWAYRLGCEPRRLWRRYVVGNITFLLRMIVYRLFGGKL